MNKALIYIAASALSIGIAMPTFADDKGKHPELDRAIHTLEGTKADLQKAANDYGGHKAAALKHVDESLKELHQALDYAKSHPDKK